MVSCFGLLSFEWWLMIGFLMGFCFLMRSVWWRLVVCFEDGVLMSFWSCLMWLWVIWVWWGPGFCWWSICFVIVKSKCDVMKCVLDWLVWFKFLDVMSCFGSSGLSLMFGILIIGVFGLILRFLWWCLVGCWLVEVFYSRVRWWWYFLRVYWSRSVMVDSCFFWYCCNWSWWCSLGDLLVYWWY